MGFCASDAPGSEQKAGELPAPVTTASGNEIQVRVSEGMALGSIESPLKFTRLKLLEKITL